MIMPATASLTMTISEAAQLLGFSKNTAYELAHRGALPGAKQLGTRWVVSRKVFLASLEGEVTDSEAQRELASAVVVTSQTKDGKLFPVRRAKLCEAGPHNVHCPYCEACNHVGCGDYQPCDSCHATFKADVE